MTEQVDAQSPYDLADQAAARLAELTGVDYSVLLEPFGKAKYNAAAGTIEWDIDYTNRMRDAQARLLKEVAKVFELEKPDRQLEEAEAVYRRLHEMEQVVLSPHIAGWTVESLQRIADVLVEKIGNWAQKGNDFENSL